MTMTLNQPSIFIIGNDLADIESYVDDAKFKVTNAENGQQGLAKLSADSEAFDVLLLDKSALRFDDVDVVQTLLEHPILRDCPVLIMKAANDTARDEIERYENVYDYLVSPFDQNLVLASLYRMLTRSPNYIAMQGLAMEKQQLKNSDFAEFSFTTLQQARELATVIAQTYHQPDNVMIGLAEILINAVEHGNLGITYDEKSHLVCDGLWEREVSNRLKDIKYRDSVAKLSLKKTGEGICIDVIDEGAGFDWRPYTTFASERLLENHGRGIALAVIIGFTKVEYHGKGNEVSLYIEEK